jgi:hypothetical protein
MGGKQNSQSIKGFLQYPNKEKSSAFKKVKDHQEHKQQMLATMLLAMLASTTSMKNSMEALYKTRNRSVM